MKTGRTLVSLAQELTRQLATKKDMGRLMKELKARHEGIDGKLASTNIGKSKLREDENFVNCISAVVQASLENFDPVKVSNVQHTLRYKR